MYTILQGDEYRNERRVFWPSGDPVLIAEGFFCIAVILAYARILYMFQISQVHHCILVMFSNEKKIIMKCDLNFNSTTFISQDVYVMLFSTDSWSNPNIPEPNDLWRSSVIHISCVHDGFCDGADKIVLFLQRYDKNGKRSIGRATYKFCEVSLNFIQDVCLPFNKLIIKIFF